jgi:glycosyltransferase involved in cell wall biosynthesis
VGGVSEYAAQGVAELRPAGDPEGLAERVLAVLGEPELAGRMRLASRQAALDRDFGVAAADIRRVYLHVLGA